jgi:hypothetical protein
MKILEEALLEESHERFIGRLLAGESLERCSDHRLGLAGLLEGFRTQEGPTQEDLLRASRSESSTPSTLSAKVRRY